MDKLLGENNKPRRILVLTASAGFGHKSAARAVAAALEELHPTDCVVDIVSPVDDERAPTVLREMGDEYDRSVRENPALYKFGYGLGNKTVPSAVLENSFTLMLFEVMRDLLERTQPDAIVSTYLYYQAPLAAVYAVTRKRIPFLTVVTDMAPVHRSWFHRDASLCLVASPAVRDQALAFGLMPDQVKVTGIPVHPDVVRDQRPRAALREELGWKATTTTALVVGSKRYSRLPEFLRVLNHSGLPLQLAVVAGGDEQLYESLRTTEWHLPAHVYGFVENMPTLMRAADFIVAKAGGLIVTEALACGLPLLLVDMLPGQEEGNVAYVLEGGAGDFVQGQGEALDTVYHWLDRGGELLAERARHAAQLGRPRAAYDVAELAWQAALQGPHRKDRRVRPAISQATRNRALASNLTKRPKG